MKLLVLAFFLTGAVASAAVTNGYSIKMDVSMKGKQISSPRVLVKAGELASIVQDSNGEKIFFDVVATETATGQKSGILMKFAVGTLSKNGERKIISSPEIIAVENEKATITVGDQDGKEDLSLSVVATRKTI